jgi:SAM-dependent methyltransferase
LNFEGAYDVVFSSVAMHWVDDHLLVLRGIAKSLRNGGRTLLQMSGRGAIEGVIISGRTPVVVDALIILK